MYKQFVGMLLIVFVIIPTAGFSEISSSKISKCLEATVVVEAYRSDQAYAHIGSGFLWLQNTQVITAWHVVAGAEFINVETRYSGKSIVRRANVVSINQDADIALLKLDTPFKAEDSGQMRTPLKDSSDYFQNNEELWAFGAPLDITTPDQTPVQPRSDNEGMKALRNLLNQSAIESISKLHFPSLDIPVLNLYGSLLLGHSGCAIVNSEGKVVGIGNGGLGEGRKWAIPARYLYQINEKVVDASDKTLWGDVGSLYGFARALEVTPLPLIAKIQTSVLSGTAPMDIAFIDRSQGNPIEWLWGFGDGHYDDKKNPIHTYSNPTYTYVAKGACWERKPLTVTLTVRNETGVEYTTSLLDAVDIKPKQVQLNLQVQPSKLAELVFAKKLPSNSQGCGQLKLAIISAHSGSYYIGQEVGLQVARKVQITENGVQVTYIFDAWSGWPLEEERTLPNGHQWARLRITKEMPEGITIMAHYKKKLP